MIRANHTGSTRGRHSASGRPPHRGRHRRPAADWLEPLESRLLFSTYTVTTLGDGAGAVSPAGAGKFKATTLRAAMTATNAHAGADTIKFAAAVTGTINLGKALPRITDALTLAGPGVAKLTVQRSDTATTDFSIFYVDVGQTATISGLEIAKGTGTPVPFESGFTRSDGGGIYSAGTLAVTNCTLSGNSAGYGGGISNIYGTLTVTNSTISDNSAYGDYGDYYGAGGGGISNHSTLTVRNCTFSRNSAGSGGGGISNDVSGTLTVTNSTLSGNSTEDAGGGISNDGTLAVTNSTLSGNSAGGGGGIWNSGPSRGISSGGVLAVTNSTLSGNSADYDGGGILNLSELTVANSTLSGNSARGFGGGIYDEVVPYPSEDAGGYDPSVVTHCTLSANVAAIVGGGIYTESSATLFNSIVAGNRDPFGVPDDIGGAAGPASAFNLIGAGKAGGLKAGVNGNRVGVTLAQLKLGPLADNGGPTKTMALLPGSVAIDAGSNARAVGPDGKPLAADQRGAGFSRIVGGRADIGAFEVQPVGSVSGVVFKDLNGNRIRDASEPRLNGWIAFADLNRDGKLTAGEPTAATDAAGHYQITGLPAGKHLIRLLPQSGWKQTKPFGGGPHNVAVFAGLESAHWDFGVQPILG